MISSKITVKARLILYHKGQILLLRQTKPNGGNYTMVGGTVESFETARESLIRESKEEAGLVLKPENLHLVHVLHKLKKDQQRIVLYFKAFEWEGKLKAKEPRKFKKTEWFFLDNLPKNLTATVRHVLEEYREGSFYSEIKGK
jgi:ADP-ribose pyrophosphatase YjhB (NUDIX family)